MIYRIVAIGLLAVVLAAVATLGNDSTPSPITAPTSSGTDDSSMKTLKIE